MTKAVPCSCLCGQTRFTATPVGEAGACHCGMCQKWSGGIYLSIRSETSVVFEDDSQVGRYRASEWGERLFCKNCGASLLWQTQDGSHQHVSIQAFDEPIQCDLGIQVFIDRKPDHYALANETKTMTEAEVFALYAPKEEPTA